MRVNVQLPSDISPVEFDEHYRLQPQAWIEAIREICELHKIPFARFCAFEDGSNLIAQVSDQFIVKVFPKFHRNQWESERRVLQHLWDKGLALPIPELVAQGERSDGWTYVILTKMPGVTLESIWPQCSEDERADLLEEIGGIMAKVHSLPIGGLKDLDPEWSHFLESQIMNCRARHQELGMPSWLVESVESVVANTSSILPDEPPVVLTGEYTPFNLLVDGSPGNWRISGMIDFGDGMVGFREYDFLGPCLFLAGGSPRLVQSLFTGYRYSNFKFQIRIDGWLDQVTSLKELEELLFPLGDSKT